MQATNLQNWLHTYCDDRRGVVGGVVITPAGPANDPDVAAVWPGDRSENGSLLAAARAALDSPAPAVRPGRATDPSAGTAGQVICLPLRSGTHTVGAIALELAANEPDRLQAELADIDRAAAKLGAALEMPSTTPAATDAKTATLLRIQAAVLSQDGFAAAAASLANELAAALGVDRVSVGVLDGDDVDVVALSHRADAREQAGFLRTLCDAMHEAIEQTATIVYPAPAGAQPRITLAHAELQKRCGGSACTIPLATGGRVFGALTLERAREEPLDAAGLEAGEHVAGLVGPVLRLHYVNERPWRKRLRQSAGDAWSGLAGPGHWFAKLSVLALLLALAGLVFVPVDYRVGATARIEGSVQRVLVAPADGFIGSVAARPGDRVAAGQVLVELAGEDMRLERRKWESELAQHENARHAALAHAERAQYVMNIAKAEGARAQLALAEEKLSRARIRAPFEGVVIKGDLTQSLGAPVQRGDVLLTVAPANEYRLIVEVDERDMPDVRIGAAGALALAALPGDAREFRVERITPVATSRDGRNFFEVEGSLEGLPASVQPGLQGVAKIRSEPRSLGWIWTHRLTDWMRLALWSWRI